ncbi:MULTISPECIES: TRAP transporter substrate-binding protein [Ancylobacter]|uniref:TRAP-type mannitol/chloroaromatic compound transport system substrate-binding protein n=2 Tax=Ancylobacter TaxID=99 RepID=A0A839Z426_9HYPH|nr:MULTISPECIES: TRAP transporter substrate-binding protein [Ancylobacter]MBB3771434.1 TRAP-type mannitol/chloroaromatic compound transport system substrate-binding protein [Ancylobacter tetraedralis]MDQ0509299.1 TRAP-type mannitol/chloroaromatic compound transport system substrate-binding protein [Ancylobacter amanitiformis]
MTDMSGRNADVRPDARTSRRRFIATAAAAAGATALAAPAVHAQAPIRLKFQSTWPNKDIFHEFAGDYVKRVNAMTGGRVELELLPAGSVVPAFQMLDAVSSGILDGGHGVAAYWYGKNKAFSLFGTAPAFGWDADELLGWVRYGGGQALYDDLVQNTLKLNVVGMLSGPMPSQPLGWFKKEITSAADMKGMKYRTVGLGADLFKEFGAAVTIVPGGEIVPAIDRGLLDGAEFNNPSSDLVLGFPDVAKVYMLGSYHQALECFEILFNKTKFESLPKDVQEILRGASDATSATMMWKAQDRYSKDLEAIKARGVKVLPTPKPVLEAQLKAWDVVIANLSADPVFKKVVDSQKEWAKRIVGFRLEYEPDSKFAYDHFFKTA